MISPNLNLGKGKRGLYNLFHVLKENHDTKMEKINSKSASSKTLIPMMN